MNPNLRDQIASLKRTFSAVAFTAAALALARIPQTAQGAIYTTDFEFPNSVVSFDPVDGSFTANFYDSNHPVTLQVLDGNVYVSFEPETPVDFVGVSSSLSLLASGTTISSGSSFLIGSGFSFSEPPASGPDLRYIGFRYNGTYYGWAEFTFSSLDGLTLTRFALGGDGESIVTGSDAVAVPEPSAYAAVLGALSLGVTALRRRRRT